MDDKISASTRVYTNIQDLKELKSNTNSPEVKKEVAKQFESILMQMVLSSMRDANKAFASDLLSSNQMDMYQDMFDKQLSMTMSNSGVGFASIVEKNLAQQEAAHHPINIAINNDTNVNANVNVTKPIVKPVENVSVSVAAKIPAEPNSKSIFSSPEEFVKNLWSTAKVAANSIGIGPEILLAQAALETNWGKNVLPGKDSSSHNLFNIKADANWNNKTTTVDTLEQKNGILVKEKSNFRSYDSFKESFLDYINLLKNNTRYKQALSKTSNPTQFMNALQDAGYATDQNYADKVLKVFSSHTFQNLIAKMKQSI